MTNTELQVRARTVFAEVFELIPQRARTVIYVVAAVVAVLAFAAQRVVAIWWPDLKPQVDATVADIVTAALFVIGSLAAAHRPQGALLPIEPSYPGQVDIAQAQGMNAQTISTLTTLGWDKDEATAMVTQQQLLPAGESPGASPRP